MPSKSTTNIKGLHISAKTLLLQDIGYLSLVSAISGISEWSLEEMTMYIGRIMIIMPFTYEHLYILQGYALPSL